MVRARLAVDCAPSSCSVLRANCRWTSKAASAAMRMTPPTALATINSMSVKPLGGLLIWRADIGALGDGLDLAAIGLVPADRHQHEEGRDVDAGAAKGGDGD